MINAESENVNTFFAFPAFLLKMTNLRGSQTSKNAGTPVKWALNIHNRFCLSTLFFSVLPLLLKPYFIGISYFVRFREVFSITVVSRPRSCP